MMPTMMSSENQSRLLGWQAARSRQDGFLDSRQFIRRCSNRCGDFGLLAPPTQTPSLMKVSGKIP